MIEMTYKKKNGQIVRRIRSTSPDYKIGDRTSMGWEVVDIRYLYKKKYYHRNEFDNKVDKYIKRQKKLLQIKIAIRSLYRQVAYLVELSIILKFISVFAKGF